MQVVNKLKHIYMQKGLLTMGVLIIHGGGLVDPSKAVMLRLAKQLHSKRLYNPIFLGKYSFKSLYSKDLWLKYSDGTEELLKSKRGTFFGTCRNIFLTDPDLMKDSIRTLHSANINTIIVCGGDGSARQCAEVSNIFLKNRINIIFAVPLTVDGINGGFSIGIEQAVRESIRQIENTVATSLETLDDGNYSVVAVELQGRNRDDILATVLQHFYRNGHIADCGLDDILLKVVPANYETNNEKLINEINSSNKRTLILISEGAKLKVSDLQDLTKRKVRTLVIGHAVQSNNMTTDEDMQRYSDWLTDVANIICDSPRDSYCIVNDGISRWAEPIDYYANLNPRQCQKAVISKGLEILLQNYMVK